MAALSIDDIMSQLSGLMGSNGATSYGVPTTQGFQATGGLLPQNTVANVGGQLGNQGGSGFGLNLGTAGLALNGLSALSGLFQSQNAFNLAKDQFKLQKDVTNTNLNNSIKSYNTTLADRLNSRAATENRTAESAAEQIERNRLTR